MWQFGGLAVMPFSIIVLSGDQTVGPWWAGHILVAFSFLATGMGAHLTQTAGLALAADRATDKTRSQVVALLYVMYRLGALGCFWAALCRSLGALGPICLPFPLRWPWSESLLRWPALPWGSKICLTDVRMCVDAAFSGFASRTPC